MADPGLYPLPVAVQTIPEQRWRLRRQQSHWRGAALLAGEGSRRASGGQGCMEVRCFCGVKGRGSGLQKVPAGSGDQNNGKLT